MSEKFTSQERLCEVIFQLYKNHVLGLANKELAKLVRTSEVNICRDLGVLKNRNWIERNISGKWRLTPEFGKIAGEIVKSYKEARLLLGKDEERYVSEMQ